MSGSLSHCQQRSWPDAATSRRPHHLLDSSPQAWSTGHWTGRPRCFQAAVFACLPDGNRVSVSGMIVAIVNSKGGVGKSTIAGSLALWLHEHGRSVILADCDPQHSSSEWVTEAAPGISCICITDADEVFERLPNHAKKAEFVIADGPGSQTETSRALLMWADLAVVPCKAGMLEARALAQNTIVLRQAQAIRNGHPRAVGVLSMVGRDYRLTTEMREAARSLQLELVDTVLVRRQAYADAPGQASAVWRMGYAAREAAIEIDRFFQELLLLPNGSKFPTSNRDNRSREQSR